MTKIIIIIIVIAAVIFFVQRSATNKKSAAENIQKGAEFLAENKTKEGVQTTASGLQYLILKEGTGNERPGPKGFVKVHYHGTLIDGTVFDSSKKNGKPVSFNVNGVIPGWTEALLLMKTGATWEVVIPAKLAYGQRGAGSVIGPNETLVFKIHLISIKSNASSSQNAKAGEKAKSVAH